MNRTRGVLGAGAVAATLLLATGCYGPTGGTAADVSADCVFVPNGIASAGGGGESNTDYGTHTLHVSFDVPAWANPGETVPITNIRVSGIDAPDLTATGLVEVVIGAPGTSGPSFEVSALASAAGTAPTDFGSATYTVGSTSSADVLEVKTVYSYLQSYLEPDGHRFVSVGPYDDCNPISSGPTVATIVKHGPAVTTTTTLALGSPLNYFGGTATHP